MHTIEPFCTYYDSSINRLLMFTDQKLDGTLVFTRVGAANRSHSIQYPPQKVQQMLADGTLQKKIAVTPQQLIDLLQQTIDEDKQNNTAA